MKKINFGIAIMVFGYFMGMAIGMRLLAIVGAVAGMALATKGFMEND